MMKGYREVEDSSTTVANGGERSSAGPDKFASSEETPWAAQTVWTIWKDKKKPIPIRNPTPNSLSSSA